MKVRSVFSRVITVAAVVAALAVLAACGGGDGGSSPTPGGGGPTADPNQPAGAVVVIAGPEAANEALAEAQTHSSVTTFLLPASAMDTATFDGLTFEANAVWGVNPVPAAANTEAFNAAYEAAYGQTPEGLTGVAAAYDAVYLAVLAAAAANSTDRETVRNHVTYVANSPGEIVTYGGEGFGTALSVLAETGGDVNYVGVSGQVDLDSNGDLSKGAVRTWRLLNGEIAPIETRDVDLAAVGGAEAPAGQSQPERDAPAGPFLIGIVTPESDQGTAIVNAAQLAVDEINGAGGLFGQDVGLAVRTGEDSGALASAALDEDGASVLITPVDGAAASAVLEAASGANAAVMVLSTEQGIGDGSSNFFRIAPPQALQMPVLANLMLEQGPTVACVLYEAGDAGEEMAAAFQAALEYKQGAVRGSESFEAGQDDLSSLISDCIGE